MIIHYTPVSFLYYHQSIAIIINIIYMLCNMNRELMTSPSFEHNIHLHPL